MKISERIKENKIFFISFAVLMIDFISWLCTVNPLNAINDYYYAMYAVDFSIGFCSRALIGSVISLFTDTISIPALNIAAMCIYVAVCIVVCLVINSVMKKCDNKVFYIFIITVLLSPLYAVFLFDFGILDIFWLLGMVLSLIIVDNKYLRWLIPLICALCLAVHNAFVLTYLPVVFLFVLYQYIRKPTKGNLSFVILFVLLAGAASVYFVIFGDSTIKISEEQLMDIARAKYGGKDLDDVYILFSLYGKVPGRENVQGFGNYLKFMFNYTTEDLTLSWYTYFIIATTALVAPIYYVIIKTIKRSNNKIFKIYYGMAFLIIPAEIIAALLSTDAERYASALVLSLTFFAIFLIKSRDENFTESLKEITATVEKNKSFLLLIFIIICKYIFAGVEA